MRLFRGGPIDAPEEDWAKQFDDWFKRRLDEHDVDGLLRYEEAAPHAQMAVPTFEHFAPVFLVLGTALDYAQVYDIFEGFQYGSISMRSFAIT